ncbi:MAG: DUF3037 domain-containing protein [Bacteroidales bacterium]|nr:DUF3037 domain-containing protein [Bacteroidales bacterium]
MQSKPEHLYEYAVVRFVPRVEREEFLNVGLIMMCKRRRWIKFEYLINPQRFGAFDGPITIEEVEKHLQAFLNVARGDKSTYELGGLPVEERFRWLTAVRSSCIQTSRPHPGLTQDLDLTFSRLFDELVK